MAGCASILRYLVIAFNLLFWLAGVATLIVGIWLLLDSSIGAYMQLHDADEGSVSVVAWLLIVAGAIITLIGCCGCFGALRSNQGALCCFFTLLLLVFCLQVAAAWLAYTNQDTINRYVKHSIKQSIKTKYARDKTHFSALNTIQRTFECCGGSSYTDWEDGSWRFKEAPAQQQPQHEEEGQAHEKEHGIGAGGFGGSNRKTSVPRSCCNEEGRQVYGPKCGGESFTKDKLDKFAHFIHNKGCGQAISDWVTNALDWATFVAVAAAVIEILGMILSMALCCCVSQESKKEYNDY